MTLVLELSTDGTSNISGNINGFQSLIIKNDNPQCLYTWCFAHRFNLMVQAACSMVTVKIVISYAERAAVFLKRSHKRKRMDLWTDTVIETSLNSLIRLSVLCRTRCSGNHVALNNIIRTEHNLLAVIVTFSKLLSQTDLDIIKKYFSWLFYIDLYNNFVTF